MLQQGLHRGRVGNCHANCLVVVLRMILTFASCRGVYVAKFWVKDRGDIAFGSRV